MHLFHSVIWATIFLFIRRDLFYLLDYVTQAEIFQISDRKQKKRKKKGNCGDI